MSSVITHLTTLSDTLVVWAVRVGVVGGDTPPLDDEPQPEDVKPGWIALGLVVALFAVTWLLWGSMRKQIGRISFGDSEEDRRDAPEASVEASAQTGEEPADPRTGDGP
jgi:type VI protein secretion system component VasK